jgi:hydrogenase nickel incorporation protein HypA/HybF
MHELSIALSIVDLAAEEAERRASRIVSVHLRLGPLAGVVKEALLSAYDLAREGSAVADSRLLIEETAVVAYCPKCEGERPVMSIQQICCSHCGAPAREIVSGRELEVIALEIEAKP